FTLNWTDTLSTGLERLAAGGIDVILLDLGLPDSSGAETFHRMREAGGATPIVLLSSADAEALSMSLVLAGAQDYLAKSSCDARVLSRALLYAILRRNRGPAAEERKPQRISTL